MSNEPTKLLLPKVDVIFKLLFGDKRNKRILIDFLRSVLDLPDDDYEFITIDDTHLKRETIDDKLGIVDVKLTTKSGKIVHIEMQILEDDDMPERVTYYNSKIFVTQIKSGGKFENINRTISILIADFELVKNPAHPAKYHHRFMYNDCETGVNFTDIVEINTLELQKIPPESDHTPKYDWLQFLKAEREEEFDMLAKRSPVIKEAVVELRRLSQSEEAQRLHDAREKALWGEQSRLRTAQNKALKNVALKMLKRGTPIQHIAEDTGLSITEIETLKPK